MLVKSSIDFYLFLYSTVLLLLTIGYKDFFNPPFNLMNGATWDSCIKIIERLDWDGYNTTDPELYTFSDNPTNLFEMRRHCEQTMLSVVGSTAAVVFLIIHMVFFYTLLKKNIEEMQYSKGKFMLFVKYTVFPSLFISIFSIVMLSVFTAWPCCYHWGVFLIFWTVIISLLVKFILVIAHICGLRYSAFTPSVLEGDGTVSTP